MSDPAAYALEALSAGGADQAQSRWTTTETHELNAEWDEVSLLRTTSDERLELAAIVGGRKGTLIGNHLGSAELDSSVVRVLELARASRPDPAHDIAPGSEPAAFESGPEEPDLDGLFDRLQEFLAHCAEHHPRTVLTGANFDFTRTTTVLRNSNGVDLRSTTGAYRFVALFSSQRGAQVSSMNYSMCLTRDLDTPVAELGSFERLLRESGEQLDPGRVPEKFVGDVIVTPDCLESFLLPVMGFLGDRALIRGTSVFRDKLDAEVASPSLTVRSLPVSDELAQPAFFTRDGFLAEDATLIERGVLRSFLLSLYGARKTGGRRASTDGGSYVVDPGATSLDDMVASVDRGVLLSRFSGGRPSDNGDFSGIAKNSYFIEAGQIKHPLGETMVSGNLLSALHRVAHVSREQVHFGYGRHPWVQLQGMTIS